MSKNTSKLLQYLGIVSGICDEVQLVQQINQIMPPNKRKVSVGQAMQAMVLKLKLFFGLASRILKNCGIETSFAHLDSTTSNLHGRYNSKDEEIAEGVVHITKGYSKDNAPELSQVAA